MRYLVGFLITIGLLILLIIMLISGGDDKPKVSETSRTLDSYASTSAEVVMTIDGPINAISEHQAVRVKVDRDNVTYEQLQGYDGNVVEQKNFANSQNAYEVFLKALLRANFTQGNTEAEVRDERGYCPQGSRYIFELREGARSIQRFWATSCGNPKTYEGDVDLTLELFQAQVPNYRDLTDDVDLPQ